MFWWRMWARRDLTSLHFFTTNTIKVRRSHTKKKPIQSLPSPLPEMMMITTIAALLVAVHSETNSPHCHGWPSVSSSTWSLSSSAAARTWTTTASALAHVPTSPSDRTWRTSTSSTQRWSPLGFLHEWSGIVLKARRRSSRSYNGTTCYYSETRASKAQVHPLPARERVPRVRNATTRSAHTATTAEMAAAAHKVSFSTCALRWAALSSRASAIVYQEGSEWRCPRCGCECRQSIGRVSRWARSWSVWW